MSEQSNNAPTPQPEAAPAGATSSADQPADSGHGAAPGSVSAEASEGPARKKKRRRRRKKKPGEGGAEQPAAAPREAADATADASASLAALAGGLLSHIDDREIPCSVDGCDNYWVWTAAEQIQVFGKPPPKRMCAECRTLDDEQVRCSVEGCRRTWTWSREAQLKHRSWLRRHDTDPRARSTNKKRRRRGRNDRVGPPRRLCDPCQSKLASLAERETVCKVHGCTRTVSVERELQLRAWAGLHTEDLQADAPLPKKMCEVCRDFCRMHPDREVACGRPGCDRTWTYKTGAQLQAFLAGRLEDPIRLCDTCAKGGFANPGNPDGLAALGPMGRLTPGPDGSEIMPCVVTGCDGSWTWRPTMKLLPATQGGQAPVDRMCDRHRAECGEPAREQSIPAEPSAALPEMDGGLEPAEIGMHPEGRRDEDRATRPATVAPVTESDPPSNETDRSDPRIVVESITDSIDASASPSE